MLNYTRLSSLQEEILRIPSAVSLYSYHIDEFALAQLFGSKIGEMLRIAIGFTI